MELGSFGVVLLLAADLLNRVKEALWLLVIVGVNWCVVEIGAGVLSALC